MECTPFISLCCLLVLSLPSSSTRPPRLSASLLLIKATLYPARSKVIVQRPAPHRFRPFPIVEANNNQSLLILPPKLRQSDSASVNTRLRRSRHAVFVHQDIASVGPHWFWVRGLLIRDRKLDLPSEAALKRMFCIEGIADQAKLVSWV